MNTKLYADMASLLQQGEPRYSVRRRLDKAANAGEITWVEAAEVLQAINQNFGPETNVKEPKFDEFEDESELGL